MAYSQKTVPHDTVATINYFAADGSVREPGMFKKPAYGTTTEYGRPMKIRDVRPDIDSFTLDANGFQFIKLPSRTRHARDDDIVSSEYYPEISSIIKGLTGATTVHIIHHVIRQTADAPSGHPHVDYCGVPELLEGTKEELRLPPHIAQLYQTCSRYCYINTWRPIKTLRRDPLALADAATVPNSDYQLRARQFPSGVKSGNYIMSHGSNNDQHHWYYMPEMSPDDLVLFRQYDTKQEVPGWRCPHTAIVLEGTEDLPPRESIECRAICFWE